jgi:hypothetical protein
MFKQCPECGQEYQPWATECAHCNVALVIAGQPLAPPREREPAESPEPPPDDRVILRVADPGDLHELAVALQEQGISSWVESHAVADAGAGRAARLGLSVRRADLDAARAIAEEVVARGLPDLEDVDVPEYDASSCPACGEPTPEHAASCASCGLEFPEVDPSSGQIVR